MDWLPASRDGCSQGAEEVWWRALRAEAGSVQGPIPPPPAFSCKLCSNTGTGGVGRESFFILSDSKLNFSFLSRYPLLTQKAKARLGEFCLVEKDRVLLLVWVGPVFRVHKLLLAAKVPPTEGTEGLWVGSLSWAVG